MEALRDRTEGAGSCQPYDSLDDLLGNTRFRLGQAEPKAMTTAVVTGRFKSAAPGKAFVVAGADAPDGQTVDFDADDAVWKTVEAHFMVDHVVSGQAAVGDEITIGLAFGPDIDPDRADQDLRDLGRTLVFLNKSPVFAYDSSLYGTAGDGSLLAAVADDGTLSLPARSPAEAKALLQQTPNLASIEAAAVKPARILLTDPTGCQVIDEATDPA
ncbi:hypothetical protein LG324_13535 [Phycicoccus jejuensis]|uniref:hypothetical protein n=1 Tax=Phycicoccus jejuensis TaxID=367299 RepID=UPI00384C2274